VGLVFFNVFMKVPEQAFCRELGKFPVTTKIFRIGKMQTDCELLQKLMKLIGQ